MRESYNTSLTGRIEFLKPKYPKVGTDNVDIVEPSKEEKNAESVVNPLNLIESNSFLRNHDTEHDIKTALTRFIYRVHGHEEEVAAAVIAFEKIQETLSEHRDYLKKQKIWLSHKTPQSKKDCELAWQDCMRAYKKLPEYNPFMATKKRQCLFDPLVVFSSS